MDILLDSNGDLFLTKNGDIALGDSVRQKINIRLRWFAGEWRWDGEEGMPYFEALFTKDPDTGYFGGVVRRKIFEVDEVAEVREAKVDYDNKTRRGTIRYTALTDDEVIRGEVRIVGKLRGD